MGINNDKAKEILNENLRYLRNPENVFGTIEGIIFNYKDNIYKITGLYSYINQIIGLCRYGRGKSIPPIALITERTTNKTICFIPGSFKPPHVGHLEMFKYYSNMSDIVYVIMSGGDRDFVNYDTASDILRMYLTTEGITNVFIVKSPVSSPVHAVYKFLSGELVVDSELYIGDTIILGSSYKGGDDNRFKDLEKYSRNGLNIHEEKYVVSPLCDSNGREYSSSDMRNAIKNNDVERFSSFLPSSLKYKTGEILDMFKINKSKEEYFLPIMRF